MKTKEEIIAVIEKIKSLNIALSVADYEAVLHYLKLSTLNPMKIDEERFSRIYEKHTLNNTIEIYNSTCKDHQVLQPLPSEMPLDFKKIDYKEDPSKVWKWLLSKYGTPTKKELVSVEELAKEIKNIYVPCSEEKKLSYVIAQHIIDTYSLNAPKREWWMDLKEGDKFMCNGKDWTFHKAITMNKIFFAENMCFDATVCTPYHEPSLHDKVKEKLGSDLYEEFMKEVKNGTK